jgi:hypothetical protein
MRVMKPQSVPTNTLAHVELGMGSMRRAVISLLHCVSGSKLYDRPADSMAAVGNFVLKRTRKRRRSSQVALLERRAAVSEGVEPAILDNSIRLLAQLALQCSEFRVRAV